jgi:sugar lactone lactonase YvrE
VCAWQTDRVFADLRGSEPGVPDGMKVDREGNMYWKTLYLTSRTHLDAVKVKMPGMPLPPQKKERL